MPYGLRSLLLCVAWEIAAGQDGGGGIAGYRVPSPARVAPGQWITLFLPAADRLPGNVAAPQTPWPTLLAGYTVTMEQSFAPERIAAPVQRVFSTESCYGFQPAVCTRWVGITIQIPWLLRSNMPRREEPPGRPENFALLRVRGGDRTAVYPLDAVPDAVHVLNGCDTVLPAGLEAVTLEARGGCRDLVTHLDGRLVTAANPALAGETVQIYAAGLGRTTVDVGDGNTAAAEAAVEGVRAAVQLGANAGGNLAAADGGPVSAVLSADQVGIYRVALVVPPAAGGSLPGCTASTILWNAAARIGRFSSSGRARFCVRGTGAGN